MQNANDGHQENNNKDYNDKVRQVFPGASINKDLIRRNDNPDLPRYIFEWLLSKFIEDGTLSYEQKRKLQDLIEKHVPDPEQLERYKFLILKQNKPQKILNHFKVTLNSKTEKYQVKFPFFSAESNNVEIRDDIVEKNQSLLENGLWGIAKIENNQWSERPFSINQFIPVCIQDVKLDSFIRARNSFSTNQWIDLLINTMGLNPAGYPGTREKIHLIARLIPYVEKNYNLIEMGLKGTGKSFLHKNISTRSFVIGGGTVTRAQLFYHIGKHQKGLIPSHDVVVFDDFSNMEIRDTSQVIGKMKNYMEDGIIDVGSFRETAHCSVVIMGNVIVDRYGDPVSKFYFKLLPPAMRESAFLDRICAFIPGWKLHPVRKKDLSISYGLIGDWFSELMHALRRKNFNAEITENIEFTGYPGRQRDIKAMKKTVSGLIKLMFPDGNIGIDEWTLLGDIAAELRQNVLDQLAKIDGEYHNYKVDYILNE